MLITNTMFLETCKCTFLSMYLYTPHDYHKTRNWQPCLMVSQTKQFHCCYHKWGRTIQNST